MDYQLLCERPAIYSLSPRLVGDRFDADFFKPAYAVFDAAASNLDYELVELGSQRATRLFTHMPGFSKDRWVRYVPEGIPYLLQTNVQEGYVDPNGWERISREAHANLKSSSLRPGDLLLTATGMHYGKAAVVPQWLPEANACPDVFRIVLAGRIQPYYAAAYLNSSYGQIELRRHSSGANRPRVITEYARKARIVIPPDPLQGYIGAKVRLAERCRQRAQELRVEIRNLLEQNARLGGIEQAMLRSADEVAHLVDPEDIGDRMDPEFYQIHHVRTEQVLKGGAWCYLGQYVMQPVKGVQPEYSVAGSVPAITVTNIDPNRIDVGNALRVAADWASSNPRAVATAGEILISVTGPPLGEAAVVHEYHGPLITNSHVAKLKPKPGFPYPNFLAAILNTAIGSSQVYRFCKGIRQKELYPEDLLSFIIPVVEPDVVAKIDGLGRAADDLEHRSLQLISQAKSDVAALVEGRLDVAGIIAGRIKPPTWDEIGA